MIDLGGGVVFRGIIVGFWGSLDDRMEFESWCYLDERDVENFCRHPISYHSDVVCLRGHCGDVFLLDRGLGDQLGWF